MRRTFLKSAVAIAAGIAATSLGGSAFAQEAADFYKGNVIKWIVPYDPGGGYDEYSRTLAPYMEKYTGARVDIVNMPGSGGMKGAVEIFNSPSDGTYIGIINGSAMVTNQLAEIEGAEYKVGDYSYLGRIVSDPRVFVAAANSGIDSFEDLQTDGETAIVGATGLGGSTYVDAVIIGDVFGIDQKVVHGFDRSGDIRTAMLRGDVDVMWGSLGSALDGIEFGRTQGDPSRREGRPARAWRRAIDLRGRQELGEPGPRDEDPAQLGSSQRGRPPGRRTSGHSGRSPGIPAGRL